MGRFECVWVGLSRCGWIWVALGTVWKRWRDPKLNTLQGIGRFRFVWVGLGRFGSIGLVGCYGSGTLVASQQSHTPSLKVGGYMYHMTKRAILLALGMLILANNLPYLLMQDWNNSPEELANTGWLHTIDGYVIAPE